MSPPASHVQSTLSFDNEPEKLADQQIEVATAPYNPAYKSLTQVQSIRAFWKSILFGTGISLGAVFDVYAINVPNSIIAHPNFILDIGTVRDANGVVVALAPNQVSNWSTIALCGTIVGLGVGGLLGDRYGRKIVMASMCVVLIIAIALSLAATNSAMWSARAFLAGMAQGCLQSSLVPYLAEIAPDKIRGFFVALYPFFWAIGILAGGVGVYVGSIVRPTDWKAPLYAQFVFLGLFLPFLVLAPESPWYLARKGDNEKAKRSLRRLFGNVPSYDVDEEYSLLLSAIKVELESANVNKDEPAWKVYASCFQGVNLRRTLLSAFGMICQAFSGVLLFYGYTTYFFQQAGYPKPFEANMIFTCIQLLGTLLSFFVGDRFGRRPLVIGGLCTSLIFNFALGGLGYAANPNGNALVALSCLWVFFYATTLNVMAYVFIGEVPTQRLKSTTASISFAVYAALLIALGYLVPYMLSPLEWNWGIKTGEWRSSRVHESMLMASGLFFGGTSAACFLLAIFLIPEVSCRR